MIYSYITKHIISDNLVQGYWSEDCHHLFEVNLSRKTYSK